MDERFELLSLSEFRLEFDAISELRFESLFDAYATELGFATPRDSEMLRLLFGVP